MQFEAGLIFRQRVNLKPLLFAIIDALRQFHWNEQTTECFKISLVASHAGFWGNDFWINLNPEVSIEITLIITSTQTAFIQVCNGQPDVEDWSHKGLRMNNGVKSLFLHSRQCLLKAKITSASRKSRQWTWKNNDFSLQRLFSKTSEKQKSPFLCEWIL